MKKLEITYVNGTKETFNCEESSYDDNLFEIIVIDDAKKREAVYIPLGQIVKVTELQYYD